MALTPSEKQKRYRERLKEKERAAPEITREFLKQSFNEYLDENLSEWTEVTTYLEWAGVKHPPEFESDEDPEWINEETDGPYRGAIGRAERMVGCFLDAATQLAEIINDYKRQEIERALAELERADLSDPAVKKEVVANLVRLNKIQDRLKKRVRWTLPEWKVKEEG
jgi:hypothetical protein